MCLPHIVAVQPRRAVGKGKGAGARPRPPSSGLGAALVRSCHRHEGCLALRLIAYRKARPMSQVTTARAIALPMTNISVSSNTRPLSQSSATKYEVSPIMTRANPLKTQWRTLPRGAPCCCPRGHHWLGSQMGGECPSHSRHITSECHYIRHFDTDLSSTSAPIPLAGTWLKETRSALISEPISQL